MAKKNYRPTAAARKKVEEQKLAEKQAKRLAFWQQYKKQIIIGAAAAVAAIILLVLAIDFFYMPAGSLRTFMGKPSDVSETAIVRGIGKHYYELGNMTTPEGYASADYGMDMTSDPYENFFYYETEDESRAVNNVYVCGVEEKTGADMVATLAGAGIYETVSEARQVEIAGKKVDYIYATSSVYDENSQPTDMAYSMLICYADTIRNSTVLVNCSSAQVLKDQIPTEEALLAEAEVILGNLQLP